MRLSALFDKAQWDVTQPLRSPKAWPDGFWPHLGAHVVGGVIWYGAARYFDIPHPVLAAAFAEAVRQNVMMEVPSIGLPLWSLLWDVVTTVLTAFLLSRVV